MGLTGSTLVLAALALAVTGSEHGHAADSRPAIASLATEPVADRCHAPASGGTRTMTVRVAGHDRVARVHMPAGYPPQPGFPLVLNLHGTGSTAAAQEQASRMDATADAHGFLLVYPQAQRRSGAGFAWNIPGTPTWAPSGPDDLGFIRGLLAELDSRYCVAAGRVYATGFSGGARMVSQLACEPGQPFAAVATVGGLRAPTPCAAAPVPVLAVHGSADTQNPYEGHGQPYWSYGVPEAAHRWAAHNGCAAAPAVVTQEPGLVRTSYPDCRNGATVELDTLMGKGHVWPTAPAGFATDEVIWRFFSQHRLPDPDDPAGRRV